MIPKKVLYIAIGAPGAGKSTYIQRQRAYNPKASVYISRDEIRFSLLKEGDKYFSHERQVFNEFVKQIQAAIDSPTGPISIYADATHITRKSRKKLLDALALQNVASIIFMVFDLSLPTLIYRNSLRTGIKRVPDGVVQNFVANLEEPTKTEYPAFDNIVIWNVNTEYLLP